MVWVDHEWISKGWHNYTTRRETQSVTRGWNDIVAVDTHSTFGALPEKKEKKKQHYPERNFVSWCFKPSQPQRIIPGLKTNFTLSIHSTSRYTTSLFFTNSINRFGTQTKKNKNTCFGAYLYSAGTQHGNLHRAGWPILFCGPTQEPVLATANTGQTRERFWGKCTWIDRMGRKQQ